MDRSPSPRLAPWQRTAAGAGLLAPDGTVAATVFAEMSALASATGAINLGQGFPDEDGPREVLDAAREAIATGVNQYPPGPGMPVLREAIARHQHRWYGLAVDPMREVLVTAGATEALAATILAFVDDGDEVVTFEPSYDAYAALVARAGGIHRTVPLRFPDWRPDLDGLRAAVTDRTRVILVNSPHNPTGALLDREALELVVELAHRHDALIVTDEVYEHLVFDDRAHVPLCTLDGMWDRTVSISSAGKTFSFTGWKVGWVTGPAPLVRAVESAKQWLTFSSGAPLQPAIAYALTKESAFYGRLAAELQDKRDLLCDGLRSLDVDVWVPEGTYFVTTDVRRYGYADGLEFCLALPERAGVVAIPSQFFYDDADEGRHKVRWAFCKDRAVVDEGLRRLAAADLYA